MYGWRAWLSCCPDDVVDDVMMVDVGLLLISVKINKFTEFTQMDFLICFFTLLLGGIYCALKTVYKYLFLAGSNRERHRGPIEGSKPLG